MRGRINNLPLRTLKILGYKVSEDVREPGFGDDFFLHNSPAKYVYKEPPVDKNTLWSIPQSSLQNAVLRED